MNALWTDCIEVVSVRLIIHRLEVPSDSWIEASIWSPAEIIMLLESEIELPGKSSYQAKYLG